MRFSLRTTFVCGASAALILGSAGVASADTISSSSTDFEAAGSAPHGVEVTNNRTIVMLVGETASVTLGYDETNDDGKQGCNLTGRDAHVDFAVFATPGDAGPAGLSGMPDSVTFEQSAIEGECSDPETVQFSAVSAGTTVFTLQATDVVSIAEAGTKNGPNRLKSSNNPNSGVTLESFDATGAGFTVVVVDAVQEGKPAPAIANKYAKPKSDIAVSCEAKHGENWRGELDSYLAQKYDGRLFLPEEEYIVVGEVDAFCTNSD